MFLRESHSLRIADSCLSREPQVAPSATAAVPLQNVKTASRVMQQTAPSATPYTSKSQRSVRAQAIYCRLSAKDAAPLSFRLPCPPCWDGQPPSGWAAERRARRAYFAALDALHTGKVADVERSKLQRFVDEVRHTGVRGQLEHLRRVLDFSLGRSGAPLVDRPEKPYARVQLTVPVPQGTSRPEQLQERFRWTLEWLQTRGYTVARDLRTDWRLQVIPSSSASGGHQPARQRRRASA